MLTIVVIAAILLLQTLAIRPWGNFPLNDDWGHALLAWHWAKSGHFAAFIPVAPSIVLQSWVGKTLISLSGFSFAKLRAANLCAGFLLAVILDRILVLHSVRREWRWVAITVWLTNPLVTLLDFMFMSDIFGLLVAYFGVWLWFLHRQGKGRWLAPLSAATIGFAFWNRQLAVLPFGGIALAYTFLAAREHGWRGVLELARRYALSCICFLLPVAAYFHWARHSGNLSPDFTHKIEIQGLGNIGDIFMQVVVWAIYQTAFALPLLLLAWRRPARRRPLFLAFCLVVALVAFANFHYGNQDYRLKASIHSHFPILGNDLNPYGIGPITLTDIYMFNGPRLPSFWRWPWIVFELLVLAAIPGWQAVAERPRRSEAWAFGLATVALTWLVVSLFFGKGTFDRYVLAAFPALLLGLAAKVGTEPIQPSRKPVFLFALACYVFYGVAGVHDYFRWNEARWHLLAQATARGVPTNEVDGGYELNAWNHFQSYPLLGDPNCATPYWFCSNRRFAISFNPGPRDQVVAEERIHSWLASYPPLFLLQR